MEWYLTVLRKYAHFEGRARRSEYWYFTLFNILITIALGVVDMVLDTGLLGSLYSLAVLIPSLAVAVRRLHDTGRSGWWLLIGLVPLIGWIVLIVFMVGDSEPGTNQYGPSPKESVLPGGAAVA